MNENRNESTPVVMMDPADVERVTLAQSQIRAALTDAVEVLNRYKPEGASSVYVSVDGFPFLGRTNLTGFVSTSNDRYGDERIAGAYRVDLSTDSILRAFDRAVDEFNTNLKNAEADDGEE